MVREATLSAGRPASGCDLPVRGGQASGRPGERPDQDHARRRYDVPAVDVSWGSVRKSLSEQMAMTEKLGTPAGFSEALRRLRRVQKSSRGAPAYSLYVNRPLGRVFAAAAYQSADAQPGDVISATSPSAGWWCSRSLRPSLPVGVLVAACWSLGYALDSADGQLARLRGGGSLLGEWLDHMIDSVKVVASASRGAGHPVPQLRPRPQLAAGAARLRRGVVGPFLRHDPGRPVPAGPPAESPGCRSRRPGHASGSRPCSSCPRTTGSSAWCSMLLLGSTGVLRACTPSSPRP